MRNDEKKTFLLKSYLSYMKYKQNSQFSGHFGRHLEFQYEESTSRLDTQAKKFAHCIIVNIQPSNLFSGGGGTKLFFCPIGFCTNDASDFKGKHAKTTWRFLVCLGLFHV